MQSVSGGQRAMNGRGREGKGVVRPHIEGNWREANLSRNRGPSHNTGSGKPSHTSSQAQQQQHQQHQQQQQQQREALAQSANVEMCMNDHAFRFLCCLIGHVVRIETRDGHVFEGVLNSCTQKTEKLSLACTYVHDCCMDEPIEKARDRKTEQNESGNGNGETRSAMPNLCDGVPHADKLADTMMFEWADVVKLEKSGVELTDFLGLSASGGAPLTDAEIASTTQASAPGRSEKQLVPFFGDDGETACPPLSLDDASSGWSATDMFRENEKKFNTVTDFDENLYTTVLQHSDTAEYRARDERARRLAESINRSTSSRAAELENDERGDEEMHYSAVHRAPDRDRDRRSGQGAARRDRGDRTANATPPRGAASAAARTSAAAAQQSEPATVSTASTPTSATNTVTTATTAASAAPAPSAATVTAAVSATSTTTSTAAATTSSPATSSANAPRTTFNVNAPEFVFNPRAPTFVASAPQPAASTNEPAQFAGALSASAAGRNSQFTVAPAGVVMQPVDSVPTANVASVPNSNPQAFMAQPGGPQPAALNAGNSIRYAAVQPQQQPTAPVYPAGSYAQPQAYAAGQAQPAPGQASWVPQPPGGHPQGPNAIWMPGNPGQPGWSGPSWVVSDMSQVPAPDAAARNNVNVNMPHNANAQFAASANAYAMPPGGAQQASVANARDLQSQQQFATAALQQSVPQAQVAGSTQPSAAAFQQQVQQVGTMQYPGQQQQQQPPQFYTLPMLAHPNATGASPGAPTAGVAHLPVGGAYQQQLAVAGMYAPPAGMPMHGPGQYIVVQPDGAQQSQQQPQQPPPSHDSQMNMQQPTVMVNMQAGTTAGPRGPAPPVYGYAVPGQQPAYVSVASMADHAAAQAAPPGQVPTPGHTMAPAQHTGAQGGGSHVPQSHGPAASGVDSHTGGAKRRTSKQNNAGYRAGGPNANQNGQAYGANQQQTGSGAASLNSSAGATGLAAGTGRAGPGARQRNSADTGNSADQPPGRDTPPQPPNAGGNVYQQQQQAGGNRPGSAGPYQRPAAPNAVPTIGQVHGAPQPTMPNSQVMIATGNSGPHMFAQPFPQFAQSAPMHHLDMAATAQAAAYQQMAVAGYPGMQFVPPGGIQLSGVPVSFVINQGNPQFAQLNSLVRPQQPTGGANAAQHARLNSAN